MMLPFSSEKCNWTELDDKIKNGSCVLHKHVYRNQNFEIILIIVMTFWLMSLKGRRPLVFTNILFSKLRISCAV